MNLIDRAWLLADRHDMPIHVAGLAIFAPPDDGGDDFVPNLISDFRATRTFARPFNQRLRQSRFPTLTPAREVLADEEIDLDYHLRYSALPRPGGEQELNTLVSLLHTQPHDPTRPLWEFHVIEGLDDGRFAMLLKIHHALMDGVSGMRRLIRMVTSDPADHGRVPVWAVGATDPARATRRPAPRASLARRVTSRARLTSEFAKAAAGLTRDAVRPPDSPAAAVFGAPKSMLNERITRQRRVATQTFELARIKRTAEATDGTVNDVFLAICAAALRRYLSELDALPEWNLTAGTPVSMRDAGDGTAGNAFGLILVNLHTRVTDPAERLKAIGRSSRMAKDGLAELPTMVANNSGVLLFGPFIIEQLTRLAGHTRPPCNLIISNVPGPDGPLYFNGASLERLYPISPIFDGLALNITVMSASGRLNLGIVGCRDSVPRMQRLADHHGQALTELEESLSLAA
ncbi:MAG: wax ester/triacylglycerol synthase family O-acyltransferase [Pseudonocardiaceae bacterium]|nr:wax ester/triacylglycerol synthase family O-acyltransferase [Pseudonocardiaceae bacterium]